MSHLKISLLPSIFGVMTCNLQSGLRNNKGLRINMSYSNQISGLFGFIVYIIQVEVHKISYVNVQVPNDMIMKAKRIRKQVVKVEGEGDNVKILYLSQVLSSLSTISDQSIFPFPKGIFFLRGPKFSPSNFFPYAFCASPLTSAKSVVACALKKAALVDRCARQFGWVYPSK